MLPCVSVCINPSHLFLSLPLSILSFLPSPPSCQVRYNVLQFLPPELQQLYQYLEEEFNPLLLCQRVMPILEGLGDQEALSQYVEPLKEITLVRLIKQVGTAAIPCDCMFCVYMWRCALFRVLLAFTACSMYRCYSLRLYLPCMRNCTFSMYVWRCALFRVPTTTCSICSCYFHLLSP